MSSSAPEDITCPACGRQQSIPLWQTINVTLNPELKADLLDWKLNVFRCTGCEHETLIDSDLLYHDMAARLLIMLAPQLGPPLRVPSFAADYRCRLVRSREELVEKVRILGAELDDRVVETLKWLVTNEAEPGTFTAADLADLSKPLMLFTGLVKHPEKGTPAMLFQFRDPPGGGCASGCEKNVELARFLDEQDSTRRGEWGWEFLVDRAYGQEMGTRWLAHGV